MSAAALFVPAPFWRRLVARSIDLTVCFGLTFVAVIPLVIPTLILSIVIGEDRATSLGAFACFVLAYVAVEYYLLRRRGGQTLGKGLLGLRVLDVRDPDGSKPVTARAALLRMAVFIGPFIAYCAAYYLTYDSATDTYNTVVDALIYLWFAILAGSALTAALDRVAHRGLHDFVAGTRVVRAQTRGVDLRQDLMMLVPGKVDLTKYPAPAAPVTLAKPPAAPATDTRHGVDLGKH